MIFKIIGSGGCVALPKPLCCCRVCMEARKKGNPYSRFGCSLYLEEAKLLIDTPEDIAQSLNYGEIKEIDRVLYSHMDPDHILGMRVFEQLRLNWLNISQGIECDSPIKVIAMKHVMEDLNFICSKHGSYFDYYEKIRNLIKRHVVNDSIQIGEIKITLIKAESATVFVFEEGEKKLIYAPCDVKPFPKNEIFKDADVMIIGNTVIGDVLKGDFKLEENNPLRDELFVMDEIVELKNKNNIKKVIMTHLEEDWGKSYDDYLELENHYKGISFAYDGMIIEL